MLLPFLQLPDQVGGSGQIADPPAVHGVALGKRVHGHRAFFHPGERADAVVAVGLVNEFFINFVRDDEQVSLPGDFRYGPETLEGKNVAGGVVRAVEKDRLGFGRELFFQLLLRDLETLCRRKGEGHRFRPGVLPQVQVKKIHGFGDENFIPRIQDRENGQHHRLGSAGRDQYFPGGVRLDPVFFPELPGDRLPEFQQAHGGGVMNEPFVQGLLGRFLDDGGRVEIGPADLQVDDLPAGPLQGHGFFQHAADAGLLDPLHPAGGKSIHGFRLFPRLFLQLRFRFAEGFVQLFHPILPDLAFDVLDHGFLVALLNISFSRLWGRTPSSLFLDVLQGLIIVVEGHDAPFHGDHLGGSVDQDRLQVGRQALEELLVHGEEKGVIEVPVQSHVLGHLVELDRLNQGEGSSNPSTTPCWTAV